MERVRKEIHLPPPIVKTLEKIAAASGKTPKKYIEELVIKKIMARIAQIKKLNNNRH